MITDQTALLLVDVITPLDFPEGPALLAHAVPAARQIATLKTRARQTHVPVIYANDNFGRWQSDFKGVVERCLEPTSANLWPRFLCRMWMITLFSSHNIRHFTARPWKPFCVRWQSHV